MQTAQTTDRQSSKRAIKRAFICTLIVLTALGAIIAHTLTKQRQASGDIVLELYKKGANGQWEVIDRAKGTLDLSASVLDLAERKEFKSNLKWEPRSEQGRQLSIKESGPGKAIVNTATGEVTLEVPYNVNLDGRTLSLTAKLTNRSISSPVGPLSGKKLEVSGTTLSAGVAGFIEIKEPGLVEHLIGESNQKLKGPARPQTGPNNKDLKNTPPTSTTAGTESLIVVIRAQGSSKE